MATEYMANNWSYHSYKLSHDGHSTVIQRRDGFEVVQDDRRTTVKADLMGHRPREFMWSPDNRKLLLWAPIGRDYRFKRIALLEVGKLTGGTIDTISAHQQDPPWDVIYDSGQFRKVEGPEEDKEVVYPEPFGFEWAPPGDAVFVIERLNYVHDRRRQVETAILRVELSSRKVTELVRMSGKIDFFMPPVSRFENGSGPNTRPYRLAFGHNEGLFLADPVHPSDEALPRRISTLPATDLENIEWNPAAGKNQLLLFFSKQSVASNGVPLAGVVLVHLDLVGKVASEDDWRERLYDGTDVHTLWFSPHGKWATWSTPSFVAYRDPDPQARETTRIVCKADDKVLEIRGVHWHPDERHLAIAAGSRLFVHDTVTRQTTEVSRFGDDEAKNFVAEPRWVGDKVLLSRFQDVQEEARAYRETPLIKLPPIRKGQ